MQFVVSVVNPRKEVKSTIVAKTIREAASAFGKVTVKPVKNEVSTETPLTRRG